MITETLIKEISSSSPWTRQDALVQAARDNRLIGLFLARCCITDSHHAVRVQAANILAEKGASADRYRLLLASTDSSWQVRSSVVEAIEKMTSLQVTARLKEMLFTDKHFVVRRDAAWALRFPQHSGLNVLSDRLRIERNPLVQSAINASLYELGVYEKIDKLLGLLQNDTRFVKRNVINFLGQLSIRTCDKDVVRLALFKLLETDIDGGLRGDAEFVIHGLDET